MARIGRPRKIKDTGIGYKAGESTQPFITKDGSNNVDFRNLPKDIDQLYAYLIDAKWRLFFLWVILGYFAINLVFAFIYMAVGIEELSGTRADFLGGFVDAFYFSAQTITTVGYGAIAPSGILAGLISSFEALIGLLSFSFITGLLYGRFSRPKASISFSDQLLFRKFKKGNALMFRFMNNRNSLMIEPEVSATISMTKKVKGEFERSFYQMPLERSKIHYLPSMWTLVHKIEEGSAFFEMTKDAILNSKFEIYVMVKYHDEAYEQQVYQLHYYDHQKLEFERKFVPSYSYNSLGKMSVNYEDLSKTEPV